MRGIAGDERDEPSFEDVKDIWNGGYFGRVIVDMTDERSVRELQRGRSYHSCPDSMP
jgi:hypothetical protein